MPFQGDFDRYLWLGPRCPRAGSSGTLIGVFFGIFFVVFFGVSGPSSLRPEVEPQARDRRSALMD